MEEVKELNKVNISGTDVCAKWKQYLQRRINDPVKYLW